MASNWYWITPLFLFLLFGSLTTVFVFLYLPKKNATYIPLFVIFGILAVASLVWFLLTILLVNFGEPSLVE